MDNHKVETRTQWFTEAKVGTFIHFGPYAQYGRGEQVLFREFLEQNEYADRAMAWEAPHFDADQWAEVFHASGSRYAVMTTRHHDGFCLWDTRTTNYSSTQGAAQCDFIRQYVDACRRVGLRVGLYYSLADWRIPAYFQGVTGDPQGFSTFRDYVFEQVRELMTQYGKIDILWFDGPWPNFSEDWHGHKMVQMIRDFQPDILLNPRLGSSRQKAEENGTLEHVGDAESEELFDFKTSEQRMEPSRGKVWEMEDTTTELWWGWHVSDLWKDSQTLIEKLVETVSLGGNYLLNVGPRADGSLPDPYLEQMQTLGNWMQINGEAIYGSEGGHLTEFSTRGHQILKGNCLYLAIRFWDGQSTMALPGIATPVHSVKLLGCDRVIGVEQQGDQIILSNLPSEPPIVLPLLRVEFTAKPQVSGSFRYWLWDTHASYHAQWAQTRHQGLQVTDYAVSPKPAYIPH